MRIELTDSCNLNCSYCHACPNKRKETISNKTLLNAFNKLGVWPVVTLSGGEPFLVFDKMMTAIQMIECSKPDNFQELKIQTNATLITQEHCNILKNYNVVFRVSLDGPTEEIHNINRQKFNETVAGIELLVRNGFKVSTTCVLNSSNYEHILEHIDFCELLGLSFIQFRKVLNDATFTKEMLIESMITINYAKSCGKYSGIDFKLKTCELSGGGRRCRGRRCILSDGTINPCGNIKYSIGNINTDYPTDVVNHKIWNYLRSQPGCPMNTWNEKDFEDA